MPACWTSPAGAYLWQVALHSAVAGLLLYAWWRRLPRPGAAVGRRLLALLLLLPLATALVPGRSSFEFREERAWFDGLRLLALPLGGALAVHHLATGAAALALLATVLQEVAPVVRRRSRRRLPAPQTLVLRARALPGWERCAVEVSEEPALRVVTTGWPGRPRLRVSHAALAALSAPSLAAVLRHEHAHWVRGRWWRDHLLFVARLVQAHNPVALWVFREYLVEREIGCDREAVGEGDPAPLVAALLVLYESTDRRDVAARAVLRRRIDLLLGRSRRGDEDPPPRTLLAVALTLALLLPWLV